METKRNSVMISEFNEEQILYEIHKYAITSLENDYCIGILKSEIKFIWEFLNDGWNNDSEYINEIHLLIPSTYYPGLEWQEFLDRWYEDIGWNFFETHVHRNNQVRVRARAVPESVPDNWREEIVKIYNSKVRNQGVITELLYDRNNRNMFTYNEMKFATHTEMNCAQALEQLEILFSPLPLFVKGFTNNKYKQSEHKKEPDFLIVDENGNMGLLEIQHHETGKESYEKDKKKEEWFKGNGIKFHHVMMSSEFSSVDKAKEAIRRYMDFMKKQLSR